MDRSQYSNYDIERVVDLDLQRLFYKRARAKYGVDLHFEYITPLLKAVPENADSLVFRIDSSIKEVESHMENFKLARRGYVEMIIENAIGDEQEMNFNIGGCKDYLKEVIG